MKFTILILVFFSIVSLSDAQVHFPNNSKRGNLLTKPSFNLNEYKSQCKQTGDTIWLPGKRTAFQWNGDSLAPSEIQVFWYDSSLPEFAKVVIVDPNTGDSILRVSYTYNDHSLRNTELYELYNHENQSWEIDSKALLFYDTYGNRDTLILQAWEPQNNQWRDSIAQIVDWIDTVQDRKLEIKQIIDDNWNTIFGYENIYYYNSEGFVYEDYQDTFNYLSQNWENSGHATYTLNEDGSWKECIIYAWNEDTLGWVPTSKRIVDEWVVFNRYPFTYYNKIADIHYLWKTGNIYYEYERDVTDYFDLESGSFSALIYRSYAPGDTLFITDKIYQLNYPDGRKQRYWQKYRNRPEEGFRIYYDDSCSWYFYKGAVKEMYRITIDTVTNQWRPAARVVYNDFVPFVDISNVGELQKHSETLQLIPNPADDSFTIENNHEITEISIFDINGKLIRREEGLLDKPLICVDVTGFSPGTYIVKARTDENTWLNSKLIVN